MAPGPAVSRLLVSLPYSCGHSLELLPLKSPPLFDLSVVNRQGDRQVPEGALRASGGPAVVVVTALVRMSEGALCLVGAEGLVPLLDAGTDSGGRVDVVYLLVAISLQERLEGVLRHHRRRCGGLLGLLSNALVLDLHEAVGVVRPGLGDGIL